jgi:adenylyl-sulfate kinase
LNKAFTMLLTGLSGAGKSTTALAVAGQLKKNGHQVEILDGDVVRDEIGHLFGYSREERLKVSKILRFTAKLLNRNGVTVVIAAISPYEEMRNNYRQEIKDYVEVYIECSLEVCIDRDTKGLYKKALRGDIKHVIGVDEVFEVPTSPNIVLNTSKNNPEQCIELLWQCIRDKNYV